MEKKLIYGRWSVIKKIDKRHSLCACICGTKKSVRRDHLVSGKSKSCGCLNAELTGIRFTKHGDSFTKEHQTWIRIKQRCNDPNWTHYGAKGIKVCRRWLNSYKNFLDDMGRAPDEHHDIDRINSDKNYIKSNCRWLHKSLNRGREQREKYVGHAIS